MNKKILLAIAVFAGGLSLTSCSDFLDAENKSAIDSDKYFTTSEGFENLSIYPYYKLRSLYGGTPLLFCSGTDLYERGRSNYASADLSQYKNLRTDDSNVLSFYTDCQDGVQQCNNVISYGATASGANVAKRVDEAKTLRSYYYYLMSQQFGGVPITDKALNSVETSFPRASQKEVYEYAINTLKEVEAAGNLPLTDNTGRVSMRFVYNLLAKLYLAYAWDNSTTSNADGSNVQVTDRTYFQLAAEYADKAINGQTPSLSFSDMWDIKNDNNADIIFAIQYTPGIAGQDDTTDGNQQQSHFGNYYNDDSGNGGAGLTKYTSSQFPASEKLIYLFEPGDDRFEGTFMVEQLTEYKNYYLLSDADRAKAEVRYYFPAWYEDLSKLEDYCTSSDAHTTASVYSTSNPSVLISTSVNKRTGKITYKKDEQSYETSRTSTGTSICVRKFDDYNTKRNGTKAVSFHDIVLAHLTETYLLGAEAYYMAGNEAKALQYVNVVRARAHAETLTSFAAYKRHYSDGTKNSYNSGSGIGNVPFETGLDPIDVILDERARELCGEYYRWMDLRRTKRLIDYNVKYASAVTDKSAFLGADGEYRWFRPFPQGEINANGAITDADQNPGYRSVATEDVE